MQKKPKGERLSGFLDKDTQFEGNIFFTNTLRLDGSFKGQIKSSSTLVIGETAEVEADIEASSVSINGSVKGTIVASSTVEIFKHAKVNGKIITPSLLIEEGAFFNGECKMKSESKSLPKNTNFSLKDSNKSVYAKKNN